MASFILVLERKIRKVCNGRHELSALYNIEQDVELVFRDSLEYQTTLEISLCKLIPRYGHKRTEQFQKINKKTKCLCKHIRESLGSSFRCTLIFSFGYVDVGFARGRMLTA